MSKYIFQILIVSLYIAAAVISFIEKDYKNAAYSIIAATLNAVVYFWK